MKKKNKYYIDILIIGVREKLTEDMLKTVDKEKIIATLSIGVDYIDKSFFESDLIKIINCQTSNVISVAEHIFSLILSLKKRIIEANEISMRGGTKKDLSAGSNDISNSLIGIIGAGKISREVIKIAKVFNMKIYCNTLNPEKHQDLLEQGVEFIDLDTLLNNSDIITVNIPLNEENRNLILNDIKTELKRDLQEKLEEEKQKRKKIEKEKSSIQQKSNETMKIIKEDAKKKAKLKTIIISIVSLLIPIIVIILDLVFNIMDFLSLDNIMIIISRIAVYSIISLSSLIAIIKQFKNLPQIEEKEYTKICSKYKIEN